MAAGTTATDDRRATASSRGAAATTRAPSAATRLDAMPRSRQGALQPLDFPPPGLVSRIQPDDLADPLLMMICGALAACSNRALCPKEIGELCVTKGWACKNNQPFALISACIRTHLKRRGISTPNISDGLPSAPGLAPPLFTSYELLGPVSDVDALCMGINRNEAPAVKRGTLWFLSEAGTGFTSPFGDRHAMLASEQAERQRKRQADADLARARAEHDAALEAAHNLAMEDSPYMSGVDGLGRGKRKRFASSIAGGDPEWDAGAHASNPSMSRARSASEDPTFPAPRRPRSDSASTPTVTSANGRRIKIRMGSMDRPAAATPPPPRLSAIPPAVARNMVQDASSATEDDEDDEAYEARLMLARRKKLRTRSEGGFPGRPSFCSRLSLSAYTPFRSTPRSAGASVHEEDEDDTSCDVDDAASVTSGPTAPAPTPMAPLSPEIGRFTAEFEHEFAFAFGGEDDADAGSNAGAEDDLSNDLLPLRLDETSETVDVDTPATTPRSATADDEDSCSSEDKSCEQLKPSAASESTLCPARPTASRTRTRSAERVPRAASEGPTDSSQRHFGSMSATRSEGDINELTDALLPSLTAYGDIASAIAAAVSTPLSSARTLGFAPAHPVLAHAPLNDGMDVDDTEHGALHFGETSSLRAGAAHMLESPHDVIDDYGSPRSSDGGLDRTDDAILAGGARQDELVLDELELAFGCDGEARSLALTAEALEAVAQLAAVSPPPFMAQSAEIIYIRDEDDEPVPPTSTDEPEEAIDEEGAPAPATRTRGATARKGGKRAPPPRRATAPTPSKKAVKVDPESVVAAVAAVKPEASPRLRRSSRRS